MSRQKKNQCHLKLIFYAYLISFHIGSSTLTTIMSVNWKLFIKKRFKRNKFKLQPNYRISNFHQNFQWLIILLALFINFNFWVDSLIKNLKSSLNAFRFYENWARWDVHFKFLSNRENIHHLHKFKIYSLCVVRAYVSVE